MKFLLSAVMALGISFSSLAQLQINEVLYDPSNTALAGDANGDGVYDQTQDEFIEFVNSSANALDVSKYKIYDLVIATRVKTLRHTLAMGIVVAGRGALVVFGGGTATGTFGGAIVVVDRGTTGLSLGNTGEMIIIEDSLGNRVDSLNTDALSDNPNESYTRNPDFTGSYVQHSTARAGFLFSPGVTVTGTPFNTTSLVSALGQQTLKAYPNPARGWVMVPEAEGSIVVYNTLGAIVATLLIQDQKVDLSHLLGGVYYLRQGKSVAKVVLQ